MVRSTGATISEIDGQRYLFAANFERTHRRVRLTFTQIRMPGETFDDDRVPRGFAPFNIQGIGNNLYVTYAKQDDTQHDEVAGAGLGFVDVFNTRGRLLGRLQHGDFLNAPWGVTLAPAYFGEFSHAVLIGNFGDGASQRSTPSRESSSAACGTLTDRSLRSTDYGGSRLGTAARPGNTVLHGGPNEEANGVFGMLTPVAAENDNDELQSRCRQRLEPALLNFGCLVHLTLPPSSDSAVRPFGFCLTFVAVLRQNQNGGPPVLILESVARQDSAC
jgi:uncharacterized protein (TIGR03118 family)